MFPGETASDGWRVASLMDGRVTETEVEVLGWSDIVQGSMKQGILATYGQMLRTAWIYLSTGTFRRLFWLSKGPMVAALYPVVMLVAQLLLAVVAGWVLGGLVAAFTWPVVGWIVGVPVAVAVLRGFKRIDGKLYAHYLMHDYAFSAGRRGATPPELAAREEDFASRIAAALVDDVDEVLVVGHSSGATIAVAVLARLVREEIAGDGERPALALLTLGQSIPMVSFLPEAKQLRADLRLLSEQPHLAWVDVSAPGDGCSFALADPVAVSGVARGGQALAAGDVGGVQRRRWRPRRWRELKRRYFRLHFQYLCAFRPARGLRLLPHHGGAADAGRAVPGARAVEEPDRRGGVALPLRRRMTPPRPESRPEGASLWRHLRLFRRDVLSAQPERLYRAKMAEMRTPFFRSAHAERAGAGAAGAGGAGGGISQERAGGRGA